MRLVELAREKPRFGYRGLHVLLGRLGEHVKHKGVHRVYREAELMIREEAETLRAGGQAADSADFGEPGVASRESPARFLRWITAKFETLNDRRCWFSETMSSVG
jgi:hypothetical protein